MRKSFGGGRHAFDIRVYQAGSVCCAKDDPEVAVAVQRGHKIFNQEGGEWNEGGMASIGAWGEYLLVPPETGPTPCWTT